MARSGARQSLLTAQRGGLRRHSVHVAPPAQQFLTHSEPLLNLLTRMLWIEHPQPFDGDQKGARKPICLVFLSLWIHAHARVIDDGSGQMIEQNVSNLVTHRVRLALRSVGVVD